jgi:hypothetical protein
MSRDAVNNVTGFDAPGVILQIRIGMAQQYLKRYARAR